MPSRTMIPLSAHPRAGRIGEADYFRQYQHSLDDPEGFWGEHGKRLDWIKPYTRVKDASFDGDVRIAWYEDGTLNASYNCVDRHLERRGDQVAILWEGDDPTVGGHFPVPAGGRVVHHADDRRVEGLAAHRAEERGVA